MGVALTPLIVKDTPPLESLAGRRLAVDGNGELYQFLALIRQRDGTPLQTSDGRITSHLVGLFYRTTRLIAEYGLELVFIFDGQPPPLKLAEIERRRAIRSRYATEAAESRAAGDLARAYSKSTMTSRLTREMIADAKQLLAGLGIPVIQAPGEAEAQAALMAMRGDVWAAASKDYDTLLFGTPRLLRFLTLTGREFLPSKGAFRPITPELIDATALLAHHQISRDQLIDLAILIGTDFNDGIKGIGPAKALKLVRTHGGIEHMPEEIRSHVPGYEAVRTIYRTPAVTSDYTIAFHQPNDDAVIDFLLSREFARERVVAALERMKTKKMKGKRRP
jgi:flap endonuclease-1